MLVSELSYLHDHPGQISKQSMDVDWCEDEIRKLYFATTFLLTVVLRSDSRLKYWEKMVPPIMAAISRPEFAKWFVSCFIRRHTINEYFANWWSTQAYRVIWSLLEWSIIQVYAEEKTSISKIVQEF